MRSRLSDPTSAFVLYSIESVAAIDLQRNHRVNKKEPHTGFNDVIIRTTFLEASRESRFDAGVSVSTWICLCTSPDLSRCAYFCGCASHNPGKRAENKILILTPSSINDQHPVAYVCFLRVAPARELIRPVTEQERQKRRVAVTAPQVSQMARKQMHTWWLKGLIHPIYLWIHLPSC